MIFEENIRRFQRRIVDSIVKYCPNLGLEQRAEDFVRIFEKSLKPESRVLDVGGGWGFYDRPLRQRGHRVTVMDVVSPEVQNAPVVIYDGKRFPFPDQSFDASLLVTVLHHIPEPEPVISEVIRVTRGKVVVVEDLYRGRVGRLWTVFRDMFYNCEFIGHPKNFKTREGWIDLFRDRFSMNLVLDREIDTRLLGLGILNGVFVFEPSRPGL